MSKSVRVPLKLFIANLPWSVGQKDLQTYFSKFGHVSSSVVIYNKERGLSKGYGFISFNNRDSYNNACNQNIHFLEGRILTVTEV